MNNHLTSVLPANARHGGQWSKGLKSIIAHRLWVLLQIMNSNAIPINHHESEMISSDCSALHLNIRDRCALI